MTDQTTDHYTTDPEYLALLRGVLECPEDDAYRLVLADWIQDHGGDKHAEAIRWFLANPDYHQSNPIQTAIPEWPEEDRFRGDPCCVVHRGFVSEVRLACREFVGGPCDMCRGNQAGRNHTVVYEPCGPDSRWIKCPTCSGAGTLPGLARRLFETMPVTRVVLTDRTPTGTTSGFFRWFCDREREDRDELPLCLFKLLPLETQEKATVAYYSSEPAALAALSDACVRYGRQLAGLPPLGGKVEGQ